MAKLTTAKKRAWKYMSEYIRRKEAGHNEIVRCFTCRTPKHWKELQGGHFIHGNSKATWLEEDNVHPQCPKCNLYLSGNLTEYTLRMIDKYGRERVDELRKLSEGKWNWNLTNLKEREDYYKKKLSDYNLN